MKSNLEACSPSTMGLQDFMSTVNDKVTDKHLGLVPHKKVGSESTKPDIVFYIKLKHMFQNCDVY